MSLGEVISAQAGTNLSMHVYTAASMSITAL